LRGLVSDNWEQMSWPMRFLDYLWLLVMPVAGRVIGGFARLTMLTKNSFLDEMSMAFVVTARSKGLAEKDVLYGHIFRNAMLIVIAGFPAVFIAIFFGGSLIIETIFSLDGLGRLAYESAIQRDYPVVFGTLYVFGLLGLIVGLLSDLTYVWVDPRIDFESRET
jgi:microcin C transport system permease protein